MLKARRQHSRGTIVRHNMEQRSFYTSHYQDAEAQATSPPPPCCVVAVTFLDIYSTIGAALKYQ